MTGSPPPSGFAGVTLDIATINPGRIFGRIHRKSYRDPLGYGLNASRFSDPRRRLPKNRFSVLYLGSTLKVCFVETILRDRRDSLVGDVEIEESELTDRVYSEIIVQERLRLVNLDGDGPIRMGIPTDAVRGHNQGLARKWSVALHEHPATIDGILYPSRLNNQTNLAIYGRAVVKLGVIETHDLIDADGIGVILNDFLVALT